MSTIAELIANSPDQDELLQDVALWGVAFIDDEGRRLDPQITEHFPNGMRRRMRRYHEAHAFIGIDTRNIIGSDA